MGCVKSLFEVIWSIRSKDMTFFLETVFQILNVLNVLNVLNIYWRMSNWSECSNLMDAPHPSQHKFYKPVRPLSQFKQSLI